MRNRSRAGCSARPESSASSSSACTSRSRTETKTPSAYSTSSSGAGFTESSTARAIASRSRVSDLSSATSRASSRPTSMPEQLRHGALLDRLLAERGQHVRDVVHEGRVRADDEHAPQLLAVREEKPRRTVQADGGLARSRSALDDERAVGLGGDEPVLVGLDRRDDVAHPAFAAAVELLEQEVGDGCAVDRGAVQRLVGDVEQPAPLGAVAAAHGDALRLLRGRGIEGPRGGRLPVDDERLVLVVVHPATPDVERTRRPVERQAPEDEPALGVVERLAPPLRPGLHRNRGVARSHRVLHAIEARAHRIEAGVRVVDERLFLLQLRMRHTVSLMKLGLNLGYATPGTNPAELAPLVKEAERLGYDSVWAAEAWGTDAVSVLAWMAASTSRIKVGSAIMQIPGRTPANTAMTAATLDLMSGGRFILGLGTSGPQVVEGWHGEPWGKPLVKTREYIEIVRAALAREVLEHAGEHYRIPYDGPGATGLGKPLKMMLRPLRADVPIYLAAIGPKNVALAAEIADGWLPIFVHPERFDDAFGASISGARAGFEIAATAMVLV